MNLIKLYERIEELYGGFDNTGELTKRKIQSSKKLSLTSSIDDIKNCNVVPIICESSSNKVMPYL